jgi:hypothetical protein
MKMTNDKIYYPIHGDLGIPIGLVYKEPSHDKPLFVIEEQFHEMLPDEIYTTFFTTSKKSNKRTTKRHGQTTKQHGRKG